MIERSTALPAGCTRTAAKREHNSPREPFRQVRAVNASYVLAVRADMTAQPFDAKPVAPGTSVAGLSPATGRPAPSVADLAAGLGQERVAARLAVAYPASMRLCIRAIPLVA